MFKAGIFSGSISGYPINCNDNRVGGIARDYPVQKPVRGGVPEISADRTFEQLTVAMERNRGKLETGTVTRIVVVPEPCRRWETEVVDVSFWGPWPVQPPQGEDGPSHQPKLKYRLLPPNQEPTEALLTALTVIDSGIVDAIRPPEGNANGSLSWDPKSFAGDGASGDNLHIKDLDLAKLETGDLLCLGPSVVCLVTEFPHTACNRFRSRYGQTVTDVINSEIGRKNRYRGLKLAVIIPGRVRAGDSVKTVHRRNKTQWLDTVSRLEVPKEIRDLNFNSGTEERHLTHGPNLEDYLDLLLVNSQKALRNSRKS